MTDQELGHCFRHWLGDRAMAEIKVKEDVYKFLDKHCQEKTYEDALNDADSCVKKLFNMGGYTAGRIYNIFGSYQPSYIIREFSLKQIIEKIEMYEKRYIELWGEYEMIGVEEYRFVVTEITGTNVKALCPDSMMTSRLDFDTIRDNYKKTGRKFEELGRIIEKMKEDIEK